MTKEEQAKGLTLESKEVRNRIAGVGLEAAKKAKPAAFFTPDAATLVSIGNFEDDLGKLKDLWQAGVLLVFALAKLGCNYSDTGKRILLNRDFNSSRGTDLVYSALRAIIGFTFVALRAGW